MQVVVDIPDQFARDLLPEGMPPEQALLEQAVLEAYRAERLNKQQVRMILGLETRMEFVELLGRHGVDFYSADDFRQDMDTLDRLLAVPSR